jgi:hypothetical protein
MSRLAPTTVLASATAGTVGLPGGRGRHPKVDLGVESFWYRLAGPDRRSGRWPPARRVAKRPGMGNGLGAVGRAELVEDVGDVLLDRVEGYHQLLSDLRV